MRSVFADTAYWIALTNPRDDLQAQATALAAGLADADAQVWAYVRRRGTSGFVAAGSHAEGEVEILERLSPGCSS